MECDYTQNENGTLTCLNCGDTTRRIWEMFPDAYPHRQCTAGPRSSFPERCGDWTAKLLSDLGRPLPPCGACHEWIVKMNHWGPDGCRKHRSEIVARLVEASKVASTELPFGLDLADLLGDLVDEAIRLAEAAQKNPAPSEPGAGPD